MNIFTSFLTISFSINLSYNVYLNFILFSYWLFVSIYLRSYFSPILLYFIFSFISFFSLFSLIFYHSIYFFPFLFIVKLFLILPLFLILLLFPLLFFFQSSSLPSFSTDRVHSHLAQTRHQITTLLTQSLKGREEREAKWREGTRRRIEGRKRYGYI